MDPVRNLQTRYLRFHVIKCNTNVIVSLQLFFYNLTQTIPGQ